MDSVDAPGSPVLASDGHTVNPQAGALFGPLRIDPARKEVFIVTSFDGSGGDSNPDVEPGTTDEDHDLADVSQPLWERYERDVADFIASIDPERPSHTTRRFRANRADAFGR
jgi:hypothetical protein